jgi:hypothetical protein
MNKLLQNMISAGAVSDKLLPNLYGNKLPKAKEGIETKPSRVGANTGKSEEDIRQGILNRAAKLMASTSNPYKIPKNLVNIGADSKYVCIEGVCGILEDEGLIPEDYYTNTKFAEKANSMGFSNPLYDINKLKAGDVFQHLVDQNESGTRYPSHAEIFKGWSKDGKNAEFYDYYDHYSGKSGIRTYTKKEVEERLNRKRNKDNSGKQAQFFSISGQPQYANKFPYNLPEKEQQEYFNNTHASNVTYGVPKTTRDPNSLSVIEKDRLKFKNQFVDYFNDKKLDEDLRRNVKLSDQDLQKIKPLIYGIIGQETNYDNPESGYRQFKYSMEKEFPNAFSSTGIGQVNVKSISPEVREKYNIKTQKDLLDYKKNYIALVDILGKAPNYADKYITKESHPDLVDKDRFERALYFLNSPTALKNTDEQNYLKAMNSAPFLSNLKEDWRQNNVKKALSTKLSMDENSYPTKVLNYANQLNRTIDFNDVSVLPEVLVKSVRKVKKQFGGFLPKAQIGLNISDNTRIANPTIPLTKEEILQNRIKGQMQKDRTELYNNQIRQQRKQARETHGSFAKHNFNLADKLRMFPNDVGGAGDVFDTYINPFTQIGHLADNIGNSRSGKELAGNLALTAGLGRMGFDPLGTGIKNLSKTKSLLNNKFFNNISKSGVDDLGIFTERNGNQYYTLGNGFGDLEEAPTVVLEGIKKPEISYRLKQNPEVFDYHAVNFTNNPAKDGHIFDIDPMDYQGLDWKKEGLKDSSPELSRWFKNNAMTKSDRLGFLLNNISNPLRLNRNGGPIVDPRGQWAHPGQITRIPSNQITMQGVPYPVLGIGNNGQQQMMYPGQDYNFSDADYVDEYPMMQKGGIPFVNQYNFLQPTSNKLPIGYMPGATIPSTERAVSIGGENGEDAYLIPEFKYGRPLINPVLEFNRTGDMLGGPFDTWQEADEWERTIRHPYVEKGKNIPTPIKTWSKNRDYIGQPKKINTLKQNGGETLADKIISANANKDVAKEYYANQERLIKSTKSPLNIPTSLNHTTDNSNIKSKGLILRNDSIENVSGNNFLKTNRGGLNIDSVMNTFASVSNNSKLNYYSKDDGKMKIFDKYPIIKNKKSKFNFSLIN